MTTDAIYTELKRKPFIPFRIYVSDGVTYEIRHPEVVVMSPTWLLVGANPKMKYPDFFLVEGYTVISLDHIVRLEPMPLAMDPSRN
jgi:hypothetical protein